MAHPTEWCVAVGRASWHQARGGHSSAGEMCFTTKVRALRYMANVKRRHKHEPLTLIPPRGGLSGARTRLDQILDTVKRGKREVTFDTEGYTRAQRERIIATARARRLHASGSGRWILIRDLGGARRRRRR